MIERWVRRLLTLSFVLPLAAVAAAEDQCSELFAEDDPALFQFLTTRAQVDFSAYAGKNIGELKIIVLPIFNPHNPKEDHRLYRFANKINVGTRQRTVRRQLTIAAGTSLDPLKVNESERLLRDKPYFADAMIVPARVCAERVDLLVVVRDVWTFAPAVSLSREGGEDSSSGGFSYGNVLGTGQDLSVSWSTDPERSSTAVWWQGSDLFGSRVIWQSAYVDSTDGDLRLADIERPFYQLDSRWSTGASWRRETREEDIELLDLLLNSYAHEQDHDSAFFGFSTGLQNDRVWRWRLGFTQQADRFYATDPSSVVPLDQQLNYPWVSMESLSDEFWRGSNISVSHRQEDIPLGTRWFASVGVADTALDSSENAYPFALRLSHNRRGGDHHLVSLGLATQGRWRRDDEEWMSAFFTAEARYYYFISRRDRWFARLRFDAANNIREDEQLTSGGSEILRGYPRNSQRGDRRWLVTVERRHFTDWHLYNLLRVGGAVYVDAGRTWDSRVPASQLGETLANAGVGLRFSSSKARADRVLHIDYAIPLTARENIANHQIVIVGKMEF